MVRAAGVEPTTFGFGDRRSIQLSYARNPASLRASEAPLNDILNPGKTASLVAEKQHGPKIDPALLRNLQQPSLVELR